LPRRIMPHMLHMPARKLGDPVAMLVLMEADNAL
jgi:hypothetical protein